MTIKKVFLDEHIGRGLKKDAGRKKVDVDLTEFVDGESIILSGGKLKVAQSSGLDCAAIGALPARQWKKGTTILAKQGDECVRLTALESLFTEVGVGIVSDKSSGFIGDEFRVTVTVTNTGEGVCPLAELVVVKPAIGAYSIKDVSTRSFGVGNVRKTGDLSYELEQLESGGTLVVSFTVVGTGLGTVQLTASVSSDTSLDLSKDNNTKTIVLNIQSKQDTNFTEYQECKATEVTDLQSGVVLPIVQSRRDGDKRYLSSYWNDRKIVVKGVNTLQGLRLKLSGVSDVAVATRQRAYTDSYHSPNVGVVNVDGMNLYSNVFKDNNIYVSALERFTFPFPLYNSGDSGPSSVFYRVRADKDMELWRHNCVPGADYTFENGVFELLQDSATLSIAMRTGPTCDWQIIHLMSEGNPSIRTNAQATFFTTSGNAEFLFNKQRVVSFAGYTVLDREAKSLTVLGEYIIPDFKYVQQYGKLFSSTTQFQVSTLISNGDTIRVRKGDHWVGGWTGKLLNVGAIGGAITVNPTTQTIEVLPTAEVGVFNFTDFTVVITED